MNSLILIVEKYNFSQLYMLKIQRFLLFVCIQGTDSPNSRIYGGTEAKKGDWGWHVIFNLFYFFHFILYYFYFLFLKR